MLDQNPIHIPLPFLGDPDSAVAVDYRYPEGFEVTNATKAASARWDKYPELERI